MTNIVRPPKFSGACFAGTLRDKNFAQQAAIEAAERALDQQSDDADDLVHKARDMIQRDRLRESER